MAVNDDTRLCDCDTASIANESKSEATERYYAEMESSRHISEEAYFLARPQIDNDDYRRMFRAGYERAFSQIWRKPETKAVQRLCECDTQHDIACPEHPNYDPTPYCAHCGSRTKAGCGCGPMAEDD